MNAAPRVAFFTDSLHEKNGVAKFSRQFIQFTQQNQLPFLCLSGNTHTFWDRKGSLTTLELQRSRVGLRLDDDLRLDFLLWRHWQDVRKAVQDFAPDLIHITGAGDIGQLGAFMARRLKVPLVASWHTNVHQYAAHRLRGATHLLPLAGQKKIEQKILSWLMRFYRLARVLLAPNEELQQELQTLSGKPVYLMRGGVDTKTFSPVHRLRMDGRFKIGYVGRLCPEKNVRVLAQLEQGLRNAGIQNYQFVIVGSGSEQPYLGQNMQKVMFTGDLSGQSLSRAYSNLDLFIFPSLIDTFGDVVLEALASGVPALVVQQGGPKSLLEDGRSGLIAKDENELLPLLLQHLQSMKNEEVKRQWSTAARERSLTFSWSEVFRQVYHAYEYSLSAQEILSLEQHAQEQLKPQDFSSVPAFKADGD